VKVAIFAMLANVVLNALLIGPLAHAGLALASSLSSIINVLLLLWVLLREKIYVPCTGWKGFSMRLFISNFAMAMVLWWFTPEVSQWLEFDALERAMILSGLIGAAVLAYFASLWLAGLRITHLRLESV
jgi:putative peptidoglycan lipid II flippase